MLGLRTALIIFGILLAAVVVPYYAFDFLQLFGWQPAVSQIDRLRHNFEFSASDDAVVFPVPLGRGRNGLLFFDRVTGKKSIIVDEEENYLNASLSSNGGILIVKRQGDFSYLLDCETKSWRCGVLLKTENAITSMVRAKSSAIFLSASPPITIQGRIRFGNYDIFLLETGSPPKQLTNVGLYGLGELGLAGNRIIFTAAGSAQPNILEHPFPVAGLSSSQIYALDYDPISGQIKIPEKKLKSLFQFIGGLSTHSTVSADGALVAFMYGRGGGQYDIAIATAAGELLKVIEASEGSFSRPAINTNEVVVNELSQDRYKVLVIDRMTYQSKFLFDLWFKSEIRELDKIKLSVVSR